jgi:hypothetical protein
MHIKRFNESNQTQLIEDYLLEYADKYNLISKKDEVDLNPSFNNGVDRRHLILNYNGTYNIREVSTFLFKVPGFPDKKRGYLVEIFFYKDYDKESFKRDMFKYIKRVCSDGYNYDTSSNDFSDAQRSDIITYYISFFN